MPANHSYSKARTLILEQRFNDSARKSIFEQNVDTSNRIIYLTAPAQLGNEEENLGYHAASYFLKGMNLLNSLNTKKITLILNCPGGPVENGFLIYDSITTSKSPVDVRVYGEAASMGTIIMQACRNRSLSPNSTLMIHDGSISVQNSPIRSTVNFAEFVERRLERRYEIYEKRTGLPKKFWKEEFSHDRFMTAEEAVKLKLADGILPEAKW